MSFFTPRPSPDDERRAKEAFSQLKAICVPLLESSSLTLSKVPKVINLLKSLSSVLKSLSENGTPLTPSLIQYTFFPLSNLLTRNDVQTIPDQVLEWIFRALADLCYGWWWTCEVSVWEQIVLLAGSVLLPPSPSRSKIRDEHTKEAACSCIWQIIRPRNSVEAGAFRSSSDAEERLEMFRERATSPKFFPILGQLVNNLLETLVSTNISLQLICLQILQVLIHDYLRSDFAPNVLPGVVSSMCKILMGNQPSRGAWQRGDVAEAAIRVLNDVIVCSVGDDVCLAEGAIKPPVTEIEELADLADLSSDVDVTAAKATPSEPVSDKPSHPFTFSRTSAWLSGSTSQTHIALNSLTPLLNHPTPKVLIAYSHLCSNILCNTLLTMTSTQQLLLSNLLTLTVSPYPSVSQPARSSLVALLNPPIVRTLIEMAQLNMKALPRLIPTHSDTKVQHIAQQIEAICLLSDEKRAAPISSGIGMLLGPMGGIERWGFSLLNVLHFAIPTVVPIGTRQFLEEGPTEHNTTIPFPTVYIKQITSHDTRLSLERMLRALGKAGGDECLFAVEWFVERGRFASDPSCLAALWCACRILEGVGDTELGMPILDVLRKRSKRLEKVCRWIVKYIAETLDTDGQNLDKNDGPPDEETLESNEVLVDYKKGVTQLTTLLDLNASSASRPSLETQNDLHKTLCLHLIAISSSTLGQKFRPLLLYCIYPLIHALVSPVPLIASTAQSTLHVVTNSTAYASPAHLLLANFDYALNSVSLHLMRSKLDVRATTVLTMLVRLVGTDVVERAGDVVEECFDRLDEYHGYSILVEGLVEVLNEVIQVVRSDAEIRGSPDEDLKDPNSRAVRRRANDIISRGQERFEAFLRWFDHRHDPDPITSGIEDEDSGPVPQRGWGEKNEDEEEDEDAIPPPEDPAPAPTQLQLLTEQIVARSLYFLTHSSPVIRARILAVLANSVPILRTAESSLLPSIHKAWPFIVNRLSDSEPFVITEAAGLVESLVIHVGDFMSQRIWEDVWPRFHQMLVQLENADSNSALARRWRQGSKPNVGTETAYSVSHRMYRSMLTALAGVARGVDLTDALAWQVNISCRRFLSSTAHTELQSKARDLYVQLGKHNADMVWLVLRGTVGSDPRVVDWNEESGKLPEHLHETKWIIEDNVCLVLDAIET